MPGDRDLTVNVFSTTPRGDADASNNTLRQRAHFNRMLGFAALAMSYTKGGRDGAASLPAVPYSEFDKYRAVAENILPTARLSFTPLAGMPPTLTDIDGSIVFPSMTITVRPGVAVDHPELLVPGADVCVQSTTNSAGAPIFAVVSGLAGRGTCGRLTSYTPVDAAYIQADRYFARVVDASYSNTRAWIMQPEDNFGYFGSCCVGSNGNKIGRGQLYTPDPGMTMAHEYGHSYGLNHVQAPPGHLSYPPWDTDPHAHAAIGPEYGFRFVDTAARPQMQIVFPAVISATSSYHTHDMMTYGGPYWVAPFHYCDLLASMSSNAITCASSTRNAAVRRDSPYAFVRWTAAGTEIKAPPVVTPAVPRTPHLLVSGVIRPQGSGAFDPFEIRELAPREKVQKSGADNRYHLAFESADKQQIADFPIEITSADRAPNDPFVFSAAVPWNAKTRRIVLFRDKTPIAERTVSANVPEVKLLDAAAISADSKQPLRWAAGDADGDALTYSLDYSRDGGRTFQTLAVFMRDNSAAIDFDGLGGSDAAVLRVVASDGVNTSVAASAPFAVKRKAPQVSLHGGSDVVTASAYDAEDGAVTDANAFVWTIDDAPAGTGMWLVVANAKIGSGEHKVTVAVTDSDGMTGTASTTIKTP